MSIIYIIKTEKVNKNAKLPTMQLVYTKQYHRRVKL